MQSQEGDVSRLTQLQHMVAEVARGLVFAAFFDCLDIGCFGLDDRVTRKIIVLRKEPVGVKIVALIAHIYVDQNDLMPLGPQRGCDLGAG